MIKTHRVIAMWMAVMLIIIIGLFGCGKQEQSGGKPQSKEKVETSENDVKANTRVVTDEFGEVEIPKEPKRVAAIYLEDYMKALGVEPIVQWYHPSWGKQDYLALDVPQFDISGNMEALLEHNPDLIIVDGSVDAAKYELYSKVAPTYRLPEKILEEPSKIVETIANLLGIPEKAERVKNNYQEKIAKAKDELQKAIGDETVAVIRLNVADKTIALFGVHNRYTGNIYKEMGLTPHPLARDMKEYHEILSEEIIPELDAEHIIVFPSNGTWTSEENKDAIALLENPLWKSVPAFKNGHVYKADRTHWQSGAITANSMKIDDLLKWFVK